MPAPKGNQFWKLRSKHGRDKLFASPELLWEEACDYFQWCDKNPIEVAELMKSGDLAGTHVNTPKARPYTLMGLCLYLDANTEYFRLFKGNLKPTENKEDEDFYRVIKKIEETIYNQKFEGASVGLFNANIIARDLGLKDNQDITSQGEKLQQVNSIKVNIIPPPEDE